MWCNLCHVWDSCWLYWGSVGVIQGRLGHPWTLVGDLLTLPLVLLGPNMDVMPSTLCHIVPPCCMFDLIWCQLGPYWLHLGSSSFNSEEKPRRIVMVFVVACFSSSTLTLACVLRILDQPRLHLDLSFAPLDSVGDLLSLLGCISDTSYVSSCDVMPSSWWHIASQSCLLPSIWCQLGLNGSICAPQPSILRRTLEGFEWFKKKCRLSKLMQYWYMFGTLWLDLTCWWHHSR